MNVAFDSWIPVVNSEGNRELASLSEVLTEGERFVDLAVRPHERVALMRLFLCVAHAALDGPKNYREWQDVPKVLPDAVGPYLKKWNEEECFELFHDKKPWLQVAELKPLPGDGGEKEVWSSLNRLSYTRASGITSTLFDQASNGRDNAEQTESEIALNLLTFQNYFVAGGKASSRSWGKTIMKNPPNPKGGPCAGKSIIYTFLRGNNLRDTVRMNLNSYEDLKYLYGDLDQYLGQPIWEKPISSPHDTESIANATQTHLGRLVPQTRILKIYPDRKRVLFGAGFVYPKYQDENNTFQPDLFATVILNSEGGRELLSARPEKAIWRDLHSLMVRRKDAAPSGRGPLCLLNVPDAGACDIIANALITNPKQAAELVSLVESVFHIPANLLTDTGTTVYEKEVAKSENTAVRLGRAIETYRNEIDTDWEERLKRAKSKWELLVRLHSIATTHYWTTVEKNLSLLMQHIEAIDTPDAIPTRNLWRKMLASAARDAYCKACGRETPRHIRAFAKGWDKLIGKKDEPENDNGTKEDAA